MGRTYRHIGSFVWVVLFCVLFARECYAGETKAERSSGEVKENTVMVYMIGSNLESKGGAGSKDILEMSRSGIDLSRTNVVIGTGGSKHWALRIPASRNCVLELTGENDLFRMVWQSETMQSMGEPDTLSEFLDFAASHYPAEHYSLIFWDHGGGPVMGFGSDELYEYDGLRLPELEQGLKNSSFGETKRLDWIGFDACLMSSIETAASLSDYADYMIASQETEPGGGWDYSFLEIFNETSDAEQIADAVIERYFSFYENEKSEMFQPDLTLSCLKLDELGAALEALDGLFGKMGAELEEGSYSALARSRKETKSYGLSQNSDTGEGLDLIDLGSLADHMEKELPKEGQLLHQALEGMVVKHKSNVENSCGVSIYYPYTNKTYFENNGRTLCEEIFSPEEYRDYMNRYTSIWLSGEQTAEADWTLEESSVGEGEITLQLTPEQLADFSSAYYVILEKMDENYYTPVLDFVKLEPDETGVLHVPKEQKLFYLWVDGEETNEVWPVEELDREENQVIYRTIDTSFFNEVEGPENIQVIFSVTDEGETVIRSVELQAQTEGLVGKNTVDLKYWHTISHNVHEYTPRYDSNNRLLPYEDWIPQSVTHRYELADFDRFFSFRMENVKQSTRQYVCQILVQTTDGKKYGSELIEWKNQEERKRVELETENGILCFDCYEDHAEWISYEGKDTSLEVPSKVRELPVTTAAQYACKDQETLTTVILPDTITEMENGVFERCIGLEKILLPKRITAIEDHCFYGCRSLKSLEIPDSVTYIGGSAFGLCSALRELVIPGSVTKIQRGAFIGCEALQLVLEENSAYCLKDGILFTADGKNLVEVPGGVGSRLKEYRVPGGVEVIEARAFWGADNLREIQFPEGLITIEEEAFMDCPLNSALFFPDSLETIGYSAFCGMFLIDEVEWGEVHFGKNFSYLGKGAFRQRTIRKFSVDPDNLYFSEQDGMLCSKAGDVLWLIPSQDEECLRIPEGMVSIGSDAFLGCENITELILPDTVETIADQAELADMPRLRCIRIGTAFSAIESLQNCGRLEEVEISDDNINYRTVDGAIYDANLTTLLYYPVAKNQSTLTIPEGVTNIAAGALGRAVDYNSEGNQTVEELNLPSSLKHIWYYQFISEGNIFDNLQALKRINVSDSPYFQSLDGLLYDASLERLICIPRGREGTITLPETTRVIGVYAIGNSGAYSEVILPEGVHTIEENNIFRWYDRKNPTLKVHLPSTIKEIDDIVSDPGDVELYVISGSYAEQWAKENGFEVHLE